MITAQKIIYSIINNFSITVNDIDNLKGIQFEQFENLAILFHIKLGKKKYNSVKRIIEKKIDVEKIDEKYYINHIKKEYQYILNGVINNSVIEKKYFDFIYEEIKSEAIELDYLSVLLVYIYYLGLSQQSLLFLTDSMIDSGRVFDYRKSNGLKNLKLVRRYPTGALSEKVALLLPPLLSHYRQKLNICSPFMIAKSLGFTGGTWDKLSVLDSIKFVNPENENLFIKTLKNCGVVYCMTEGEVAPYDKYLYQFRSLTGTISSKSLIISSIASKQLAIPVDFLLLDFRYGEGSFVDSMEEAQLIGNDLALLLNAKGICCEVVYTSTSQLNGVSVGNLWELYEAICLLKGEFENNYLKLETSQIQINLLINFFVKIYLTILPETNEIELRKEVFSKIKNGDFYEVFLEIMNFHNVQKFQIEEIYNLVNLEKISQFEVLSSSDGEVEYINQKGLGILINYELNNNNYDFFKISEKKDNFQGVILHKTIGEKIKKEEKLCTVFSNKKIELSEIENFFTIKSITNKNIE